MVTEREVLTLVVTHSALTVEECTAKCDALFNLVNETDERASDQTCASICKRSAAISRTWVLIMVVVVVVVVVVVCVCV